MAHHNTIGKIGENIATKWLITKDYSVIERNYQKKWGEIDIIVTKDSNIHFVEVKSVSYGTDTYRPEDNVHPQKLKRLSRTIEAYLLTKHYEGDWRFDVIAVYLNPTTKEAKIRHTEDIVIGA